jgi:hypothetical protein
VRVVPLEQKSVLVVLFVPGLERDGKTPVDQERWVKESLEFFGRTFGGATAYPRGRGVWRDDSGALVYEDTVAVHSYVRTSDLTAKRADLDAFCKRVAREAKQSELAIFIGADYAGCSAE